MKKSSNNINEWGIKPFKNRGCSNLNYIFKKINKL
jgi:hypothetical protein